MSKSDMRKKAKDIADICYYLLFQMAKDNAKARGIKDVDALLILF